jgi:hypothetical protein
MIEKRVGVEIPVAASLEFQMILVSLSKLNGAFKYHKHSSIKCNELRHSCVHSCSFTWKKRDFIFCCCRWCFSDGKRESKRVHESPNLSTFPLINMLIDDTSDSSCVDGKSLVAAKLLRRLTRKVVGFFLTKQETSQRWN